MLPVLRHGGAECRYLSGAPLEIPPLLGGRQFPEPLLVTRQGCWEQVRGRIRAKGA